MVFYINFNCFIGEIYTMRKKTKIIGTEEVIIKETGEKKKIIYQEVDEYEKDSNFYKVFLNNFSNALSVVANQKTKLVLWILENITKNNLLLYTYRQISDETGISYATVAETMKTLQNADFMRKHSTSYYMINPDIIFKGKLNRRCFALDSYHLLPKPNDTLSVDKARLHTVSKKMEKLEKRQKELSLRIEYAESEASKND